MALKFFIYTILFSSIYFLIGNVESNRNKNSVNNNALLSFDKAIMYTLNDKKVTRIVKAESVKRFKNKDLMFNAEIILANKDQKIKDIMKADVMVKEGDKYSFLDNASFHRSAFLSLKSDEFFYNSKNGIITNTKEYNGRYYNNTISGEKIYFDSIKNKFRSKNVHFEIDIIDN